MSFTFTGIILHIGRILFIVTIFAKVEARLEDQKTLMVNGRFFGDRDKISAFPKDYAKVTFQPYWFSQHLDHFNTDDHRMWNQRFFKNNTFFQSGGPACVMVGGEGEADPRWLLGGEMIDHCRTMNGVAYQIEHRFYGESQPFSGATTESLRYLSIPQALADIAHFVQYLKTYEQIDKVMLYGGSYAGSLVAYFRQHYSYLVDVSLASSAPIHWEYDFPEYLEVVGDVLKKQSQKCYDIIDEAMNYIETVVKQSLHNPSTPINSKLAPLKLCGDLHPNNDRNVQFFVSGITGLFSYHIQYDNHIALRASHICQHMTKNYSKGFPEQTFKKFAETFNWMMEIDGNKCIGADNEDYCDYMNQTAADAHSVKSGTRMWIWQTCNEVGSYQTTSSQNQPFGRLLKTSLSAYQCRCSFGDMYTEEVIQNSVNRLMSRYGGLETPRPRVIYTNGAHDPWSALGITDDKQLQMVNHENNVLLIEGGSHCTDLLPDSETDSASLRHVRSETLKSVHGFMKFTS